MTATCSRGRLAAALLALASTSILAQTRPTPAQAQELVRSATPETIARLQSQLAASGLTPSQIHDRLRAAGYPESLLDAYLPGGGADSTAALSADVFAAVRKLGLSPADDAPANASLAVTRQPSVTAVAVTPAQADSGFQLFGIDVFQRQTSQFDANLAGPVPKDYKLGPGDELVLLLTGDVEAAYNLTVTREGFVVIPNVGEVPVANLTLGQLNDLLYSRLGRSYSGLRRGAGATTHFDVSLSRLGTSQVSVLGDVATPGSYRVSKLGTILSALYASGGPTQNGDMRNVELRRAGQLFGTLDLYDYLLAGNASNDIRLETGDIVFVPARGSRVRLAGAVVRPATYELKGGETLRDLLRMGGGFRPEADRRRLQIDRVLPPSQRTAEGRDRILFDVSSATLETSTEPLQPGDVVHVLEISGTVANRVTVSGNVWAGGAVAFTPGMMLSEALRKAGGLRSDTYLPALQISRLNPDGTRRIISVALRDTLGTPAPDVLLQSNDEIHVFSLTEYRTNRYVVVTGAVKGGGQIPYREGMTLREALMIAGGLQESASLTEAEVAHMPADRTGGALATTERVPLDSTYLFERTPDGRYLGPPGIAAPTAKAPEVPLRPYDNVLILQQPDWSLPRSATIGGEVRYPGSYTLRSTSERLSDLIQRAGGLTTRAYPNAAVFTRTAGNAGRVSIDLPSVLVNSASNDNVVLLNGDQLTIPAYIPLVKVTGAVYAPSAIAYVPGADLDFYVQSAGGGTPQAQLRKAYVAQPNGRVQTRSRHLGMWTSSPTPQPGSVIIVPAKDPNAKTDWLGMTSTFTSILGSLVAIAAIVRR